MKRKKPAEPEYRLNIFRETDERTKAKRVIFLLRTVKEFTSFKYEILLEASLHGQAVTLKILGLHAPELLMPGTGPALARKEFDNLRGTYDLTVTKLDGQSNQFRLTFSSKRIEITPADPHPFLIVTTEPVLNP